MKDVGLISASGTEAAAFLHAQLTSDVLALTTDQTQYSGYCSAKGRLLATFLLWRNDDEILLQLPRAIQAQTQTRLSKYVLRARVTISDATERYRIYGLAGADAQKAVATLAQDLPAAPHDVIARDHIAVTRLSLQRYIVLVQAVHADAVHKVIAHEAAPGSNDVWVRSEIEAGVPWITSETLEQFIPQMVNLDLLGALSYSKGCYPGQEIVARTHFLGRLKQRMYRLRLRDADAPVAGDALYSPEFGADQASGTLVNVAPAGGGTHDALAVIRTSSARDGNVHWKTLDGPLVEFLPLPYPIPSDS